MLTRATIGFRASTGALAIGLGCWQPPSVHDDDIDGQIQEIVVTAQKRAENAKDVPVSISQISGEYLNARHIADFDDLTRAVPSVSFASGGTEGLSNIEIRGVSSAVGNPVVGVYLDESSITLTGGGIRRPSSADPVRSGASGGAARTAGNFYGASSMGGAIRFITNQPKLDGYEVDVASDLSGTDYAGVNYNESIVVNAPITPNLAVSGGRGLRFTNSGWIDHFNYLTGATRTPAVSTRCRAGSRQARFPVPAHR
jgi:iron complex outermembrane receptor protein